MSATVTAIGDRFTSAARRLFYVQPLHFLGNDFEVICHNDSDGSFASLIVLCPDGDNGFNNELSNMASDIQTRVLNGASFLSLLYSFGYEDISRDMPVGTCDGVTMARDLRDAVLQVLHKHYEDEDGQPFVDNVVSFRPSLEAH